MHNDMKAIALTEYAKVSEHIPGKVEMLQCEKPTPGPEDVLIRIAYASICGSDAHVVRGNLTPELEAAIRREAQKEQTEKLQKRMGGAAAPATAATKAVDVSAEDFDDGDDMDV